MSDVHLMSLPFQAQSQQQPPEPTIPIRVQAAMGFIYSAWNRESAGAERASSYNGYAKPPDPPAFTKKEMAVRDAACDLVIQYLRREIYLFTDPFEAEFDDDWEEPESTENGAKSAAAAPNRPLEGPK